MNLKNILTIGVVIVITLSGCDDSGSTDVLDGILDHAKKDKHEYVDLGLSVKWATCNVGANAPEEYGDYFAWGESEPYYTKGHAQDQSCTNWKSGKNKGYDWSSYRWCKGSQNTMTKYCTSSCYGIVDNKTVLAAADDAATAIWGGSWRMPTLDELKELRDKCTWIWTTKNGVYGYNVVGPNGKSIFLPAAGCRHESNLSLAGSYGNYWSSSLNTSYSYCADYLHSYCADFLHFDSSYQSRSSYERYFGLSVRPVCQ